MITRATWISTLALGVTLPLLAEVAGAADPKPDQRNQPSGSVRRNKSRTTHSAKGPQAIEQLDRERTRDRSDRDAHGARGGERDGDRDTRGGLERHGRSERDDRGGHDTHAGPGERDGRHDRDEHGDQPRFEFPGVRRPQAAYREFHHGADSVRVYGRRPLHGSVFLRPPEHCDEVHFGERRYFVADDVYYIERPVLGEPRYVVVPPPVGVHVRYLPETAVSVQIGGFSFFYSDDTYYRVEYVNDAPEYVVADVPIGASIMELPEENEPVFVGEVTYYRVGTAFYQPYFQEGRVVYVHVAAPW